MLVVPRLAAALTAPPWAALHSVALHWVALPQVAARRLALPSAAHALAAQT